jgi:hypothetical protein
MQGFKATGRRGSSCAHGGGQLLLSRESSSAAFRAKLKSANVHRDSRLGAQVRVGEHSGYLAEARMTDIDVGRESMQLRLFLTRGLVAIVWAAVFAIVSMAT